MINFLKVTKERFLFWFKASRGYSLPISIMPWFIVFSYALKYNNGNLFYGIVALVGIIFAHLGTNLFDDFIDFKDNIPKQKYKSTYIDNNETNLKTIFKVVCFYFFICLFIGLFFTIKFGIVIPLIVIFVGVLCLLYPKINNYGFGEVVVGTIFGPILFFSVNYIMTNQLFNLKIIALSFLIFLFTIIILDVHAYMDYDTDIIANKRTLCTILKSKNNAYFAILILIVAGYFLTSFLILKGIISYYGFFTLLTIPQVIKLLKSLKNYKNSDENAFINNFIMARNLTLTYEILLLCGILL